MLAEKVACRMYIRFFNKKQKTGSVCIQQQQNFTHVQMKSIEDDNNNATKNQSLLHEA